MSMFFYTLRDKDIGKETGKLSALQACPHNLFGIRQVIRRIDAEGFFRPFRHRSGDPASLFAEQGDCIRKVIFTLFIIRRDPD